jgi:hypothetical protein
MWCVPTIDKQFVERMEDVVELYAKPYDPQEPVVCFDEKSKQLLEDTRPIQHTTPCATRRRDYTYKRNGTRNVFLTVEPKGGHRAVVVTKRRTKQDFACEIKRLLNLPRYRVARCIHIVLDNLNTHFEKSFIETFGETEARTLMNRIRFHHTPKHASWLNMAEIEISILSRQCIRGRIPTERVLRGKIHEWQKKRNTCRATINWKFTTRDARKLFNYKPKSLS